MIRFTFRSTSSVKLVSFLKKKL